MKVLVTGASGFIGKALCIKLRDTALLRVVRKADHSSDSIVIDDIAMNIDWSRYLIDVDVVIHLAALAHESLQDVSDDYIKKVNELATLNLAKHAKQAGVKRFIYLSSIGVNGCQSDVPFKFSDTPCPHDLYSQTKLDAEVGLKETFSQLGTDFVIIRPPLVYGKEVRGNFYRMLKWISRELPLPFGAVSDNRRSLVYVDNLADLISVCIFHPRAANQTFLVSDDEDASTMQLIRQLADSLGAKCRLLHIPPKLLSFVGRTIGRKGIEKRLIASLQVDIEHTKNTLNWKPPYTMEYGLRETAQWYKTTKP